MAPVGKEPASSNPQPAGAAADPAEPTEAEQKRMEARSAELVTIIGPVVFLNVVSGAMLWTARQAAVAHQYSSPIELTVQLTRLGSLGSLMEFLINPVVGKLSDVYGRRSLIYLGNFSTVRIDRVWQCMSSALFFVFSCRCGMRIPAYQCRPTAIGSGSIRPHHSQQPLPLRV